MGILDVKIDIQRETHWKTRNRRIQSFNARSNHSNSQPPQHQSNTSPAPADVVPIPVDYRLYRSAKEEGTAAFEAALEQVRPQGTNLPPHDVILKRTSPRGNTLLHTAAEHGNSDLVEKIYDFCKDRLFLLAENLDGDTALHIAARVGNNVMVDRLFTIQKNCVDAANNESLQMKKNKQGNTAMHVAVKNNHDEVVKVLLLQDSTIEVIFHPNNERKSALCIAAEAGNVDTFKILLAAVPSDEDLYEKTKTSSLVHSAILGRHKGIMEKLLKREPKLIHLRDSQMKNPLHLAAKTGYVEGVIYLLNKYPSGALERDEKGFFPLHWAAFQGHVPVIKELVKYCLHPVELIDNHNQNILHIAARRGRLNVINYLLETHNCEKLINDKDKDANTPLLLATINWHPKIVSTLTWVESVDLEWINNEGLTAIDAAEHYMDDFPSFRQRLTWTALRSAGAPTAPSDKFLKYNKDFTVKPNPLGSMMGNYKDRINTLLLVATLVATITFAAGFTVPGGYNDSVKDKGFATLIGYSKFHLFVICNTIAMYCAIVVALALIWAQLGDLNLMLAALRVGLPMLGVSISMMSLAFMAGLDLAVNRLNWLSDLVFVMGLLFLAILVALAFPLCFPISSNYLILRYISYYPFCLLIFVTGSHIGVEDSSSD